MNAASLLEKINARLPLPVWGVEKGVGSFLTIEAGESVSLVHGSTHREDIQGVLHFWIYCCDWELHDKTGKISDSSRISASNSSAVSALLNGLFLERVEEDDVRYELRILFSGGVWMQLNDDAFHYEDEDDYLMVFFNPSRKVIAYNRNDEFYEAE